MPRPSEPVSFDTVRRLALALPGVEEGTSYGTAALKVRGTLLARLREDGETLVLRTTFVVRDHLMHTDPETFFITDHYRDWPLVLVRLPDARPEQVRELLEDAWRRAATKRAVAAYDAARAGTTVA